MGDGVGVLELNTIFVGEDQEGLSFGGPTIVKVWVSTLGPILKSGRTIFA